VVPKVDIVPATIGHCHEMGPEMRQPDANECWALGRMFPIEALEYSVRVSSPGHAWSAMFDDKIAFMTGLHPHPIHDFCGMPWLLSAETVNKYPLTFYKVTRRINDWYRTKYPVLLQLVDARYERSLKWVERLGYTVGPMLPSGITGEPFRPIWMGE
jgi:hypothetical protein